jgi:hypothetical protein
MDKRASRMYLPWSPPKGVVLALLAALLLSSTPALAGPLDGMTIVRTGACAAGDAELPCAMLVKDGEENGYYLAIADPQGEELLAVIRVSRATGEQTIVWPPSERDDLI